MKWYSVKEHQPILPCCCILLAIYAPITGSIYLSLGEWDNGWKDWDEKFDIEKKGGYVNIKYFIFATPILFLRHMKT